MIGLGAITSLLGGTQDLQPTINAALSSLTGAIESQDPTMIMNALRALQALQDELAALQEVAAELKAQIDPELETRNDMVGEITAANDETQRLMEAARQRRLNQ